MDSLEFRNKIFLKRPRYANIYKDLIDSLANKGSRSTDYIQFGPIYQIYIYAFFIGYHRNERIPLPPGNEFSSDFLELGKWKSDSLVHFILMLLFSRKTDLGISSWIELEDMDEEEIDSFIKSLITTVEEYANAGFLYLKTRFEEDRNIFNETFVFANILKDVVDKNEKVFDESSNVE